MNVLQSIFEACAHDDKTPEQMALKLSEEVGEAAQATLSFTKAPGCAHKGKTREDVIEEACDCIISAGALIFKIEQGKVNETYVQNILKVKLEKWIAKCDREKKGL